MSAGAAPGLGGGSGGPGGAQASLLVPVTAADVLHEVERALGSVVLVNLWATWCIPCREEFPALLELQKTLASRGFKLILVSADFANQRPQVEAFLARQGVGFRTFLKAQADEAFIAGIDRRWSGALPASALFDRAGREVAFWEGKSTYAEVFAKVTPLLGGP